MGIEAIGLGLMAGSSIYGANKQSKAARAAGNAQERAAAESAEVQREGMRQMRAATEPFRFGGQQAINPLMSMMGLPQTPLPSQPLFDRGGYNIEDQTLRAEEIRKRIAELEAGGGY